MTTSESVITSDFLRRDNNGATDAGSMRQTAVVVLNWELPVCSSRLLSSARLRICADGGANQLFDELPGRLCDTLGPDAVREKFAPDVITGDMDSARPEVLEFYRRHGAEVIDLSEDQDSTDLHKCLAYVERRFSLAELQAMTIVVLGGMGGRIDHTLSNLNTLLTHSHMNLVLLGEKSTARLLPAGSSTIQPLQGLEGPVCSLVPIAGPATATSTGLKWNLKNTRMEWGGLMSTSNLFSADKICVTTDRPLLWTTEFDDR